MLSKHELTKEFNYSAGKLSVDAMRIAVETLKNHEATEGHTFNCVVCDRDNNDELSHFLISLNHSRDAWKDEARCQIIYSTSGHWSALDIQIKNGDLDIYLLDAANSYPHTLSAISLIHEHCQPVTITYHGPSIQGSGGGSDYFALDHALSLSKIDDLHSLLPQYAYKGPMGKTGEFSCYADYMKDLLTNSPPLAHLNTQPVRNAIENTQYISVLNLPLKFGSLFKNIQNMNVFRNGYEGKGYYLGQEQNLLDDYVTKHTIHWPLARFTSEHPKYHAEWVTESGEFINFASVDNKEKIQKRVLEYLSQPGDGISINPRWQFIHFLDLMLSTPCLEAIPPNLIVFGKLEKKEPKPDELAAAAIDRVNTPLTIIAKVSALFATFFPAPPPSHSPESIRLLTLQNIEEDSLSEATSLDPYSPRPGGTIS